jgi:hypothetical protein
MRYLFGFICVLALGFIGCGETASTGGGGSGGSGGLAGGSGSGGQRGHGWRASIAYHTHDVL